MYALVKYYDNIYYVRKSRDITITKNVIKCKYRNERSYPSSIIAKNGKLEYSYIWLFIIDVVDIYANLPAHTIICICIKRVIIKIKIRYKRNNYILRKKIICKQ